MYLENMEKTHIYILGIESSCDDTSAAVIRDGVLLSNVTASQAVHEASIFISSYKQHPSMFVKGLYLVGNFGVGKTYLLGAIAKKLAEDGYDTCLLYVDKYTKGHRPKDEMVYFN